MKMMPSREASQEDRDRKIHSVIAVKITPIWNTLSLVFAAVFAYFVIMTQNTCFSKDQGAWAVEYANTVDVSNEFYLLNVAGITFLLVSVLMYYLESKEDMQRIMRPYVLVTKAVFFLWFVALCYYRFRDTGRACSGDFLDPTHMPANYSTVYLADEGHWTLCFIVMQMILWIVSKIVSLIIYNKIVAESEEDQGKMGQMF